MVSVIIPVFNAAGYLSRCLESVLAQTVRDLEVVCIDDGSQDSSAQLVEEFAARDARVRLIRQANTGQGGARNRALDEAKGEYFTFVDADDAIAPCYIEAMMRALAATGAPVAANAAYARFDGNTPPSPGAGALEAAARARVCSFGAFVRDRRVFSAVWNKLYRRDALGGIRFLSHPFEDWPYLVKVFAKAEKYARFSVPLYYYNTGSVSTIRSPFGEKKIRGYLTGIEDVTALFKDDARARDVRRRAAVAAKMLMGKARKCPAPLREMAQRGLKDIIARGLLTWTDLDLKTLWRLV